MYMSVLCLVVITWAIVQFFADYQGLASVRAELTNTIWEELRSCWVSYKPGGDKHKNVIFLVCHHGLSCVHVMHHRSNPNAQTHTWT